MKKTPLAAIAPLVIMMVIFCLYFDVLTPWFIYSPRLLVPLLNVVFLSVVSFFIAHVSAKSYLASGNPLLIFLGCGSLAVGFASMAAGWSTGSGESEYLSTAINNTGFFLGGIFHLAGAVLAFLDTGAEESSGRRKKKVVLAYTGLCCLILLSIIWAFRSSPSLFLNPHTGPTPFRQLVLGSAIVLFALASLFFLAASYRLRSDFLYWYALGLALISSGLLAFFFTLVEGSPIAWAGRIALYAGGIYLLIALSQAMIKARSRNVPLERIVNELIQKPHALYESLVRTTSDAIISIDRHGRVLLWNQAAERMFGFRGDEVVGLNAVDLVIPQANAEILNDAFQGQVASSITRVEIEARRRGGEVFHAEISVSKTKAAGEQLTTLMIRDITERKKVEKEMRQTMEALGLERSLLNAVLEQMPAGVIIAEAKSGRLILGNRNAENLWREGFREDRSFHADGSPYNPEEWPLLRSVRSGEVILQEEISFSRADGTRRILSVNSAPIRDDRNRIIAGVITLHDITARKVMEDELRRSRHELEIRVAERTAELERKNKELKDFAFIASHDLQEPLRKIQTFGDLLLKKAQWFADEETRDYVSRMQKASSRMELLLRSLLNYSRLSSNAQCFSEIDLNQAAREAMSNLEIRIKETEGAVDVEKLPTIEADSSQICQVFQNLIGNALKFHRQGERPRVRIYAPSAKTGNGNTCEIFVEDNGIGFDEKYLDRIFLPFQRLHGMSEFDGVGMGLAICKKIIERHGGTITARSTAGKGSTFVVSLPARRSK